MTRLDAVSERLRGRLGGGPHEAAHVSVICDCGDEFLVRGDADTARCPTCHRSERVVLRAGRN
jgi:hypothetical protein